MRDEDDVQVLGGSTMDRKVMENLTGEDRDGEEREQTNSSWYQLRRQVLCGSGA